MVGIGALTVLRSGIACTSPRTVVIDPRRTRCRGAAAACMILVLVLVQLVVVSAVVGVGRDVDTIVNRVDSCRGFYAAEAGMNMAVRELIQRDDLDGDGRIGSISDDSNDSNDPVLGNARVCVTATVSGGQTTVSSASRCGISRQRAEAVLAGASGGAGPSEGAAAPMIVYAQSGSNNPRSRTWSGASWSSATTLPSVGGQPRFVVAKPCPTRDELIAVTLDSNADVNLVVRGSSSWGSVTQLCTDVDTSSQRAVDLAYEASSGDALVVYWRESSNTFAYRTWNGTLLSSEQTLSPPSGAGFSRWIALYSRPDSDQIILLAHDNGSGTRLSACVWSGSAFGSWTTMTTSLQTTSRECFALAFEGTSGRALVAYAVSSSVMPRYRTWSGSSWSAESTLPSIGGDAEWIRLASDPASNYIVFTAIDVDNDIEANIWNGSAWASNSQLDGDCSSHTSRALDVAFERSGGRAVVVYREKNKNSPTYRTWTLSDGWSSASSGPNLNRKPVLIQVARGSDSKELHVAVADDTADLHLFRWTGSIMSSATEVETSLVASDTGYLPFMLTPSGGGSGSVRLMAWTPAAP